MGNAPTSESRQDGVDVKLIKLRKATAATEKLLFGDLAGMACRTVASPDLPALKLQLAKLTMVFGLDCFELAKILTAHAKLEPASTPVQDASRWLIGVKNQMPPELQTPAGLVEIQKAAEAGDTKFFIQLGERLNNSRRKSAKQKKRETLSHSRFTLWFWWQPNHGLNWPGLAYCKHSAQWDFFDILIPRFRRDHSKNYLDNERGRIGLTLSRQCFVSEIKGAIGNLRFS
jgi:hypothetical protein